MKQHEIPGHVAFASGNGGLPKIVVTTKSSTAEIYLHGAHIAHFQKNCEPPLLFLSAKSHFAVGEQFAAARWCPPPIPAGPAQTTPVWGRSKSNFAQDLTIPAFLIGLLG